MQRLHFRAEGAGSRLQFSHAVIAAIMLLLAAAAAVYRACVVPGGSQRPESRLQTPDTVTVTVTVTVSLLLLFVAVITQL